MTIHLQLGQNPPELAVCWYLGQMLATEHYLSVFLKKYLNQAIAIKEVEITREKSYGNKRIDLCTYLTDTQNNKFGLVIEVKTHWPDENQLQTSVERFRSAHGDFKEVFGLHFLSTLEASQHVALVKQEWKFPIVTIKDLLKSFCESGIETGHSLNWASNLQQLLNYQHS